MGRGTTSDVFIFEQLGALSVRGNIERKEFEKYRKM